MALFILVSVISTQVMLGTGNILLVLLSLTCHTDYAAVAECPPCQTYMLGMCLDDTEKSNNDPYCLGCNESKFYEVKFTTGLICPPCATENNVEKTCKPDAQKIKNDKYCKKCPVPTTTKATITTTTTISNHIPRDKHPNGEAVSVCLLGHLFLLPIVNLFLLWKLNIFWGWAQPSVQLANHWAKQ